VSGRYLLGIDLGTTNSALAYIHTDEHPRVLRDFPMPQLVGPADLSALATLPSLHHHVAPHELPAEATRLPWTPAGEPAPDYVIGELARRQAQLVPGRCIASAKSWLCHPRVDRLADILPWGADADVPRLSPVEASARYLRHMLRAFCSEKRCQLDGCEVVLTVPASFDEVARELTVEAARRAGLRVVQASGQSPQLTLVEEPQAAFYHWLAEHARLGEDVEAGELVFVCDIGGGTTDFTLIQVNKAETQRQRGGGRGEKKISFTRTAVGDHILLGGDNMDLALARLLEQQVQSSGRLRAKNFSGLVQACRLAKEKLLDADPPEAYSVHIAGRGSKLIGGGLQAELRRAEVERILIDGFFPRVGADAEPARSRGGLTEFGLPYAADPGITRYIAAFLRQHHAQPTTVLFNGGVLRATAIRERLLEVLTELSGKRPRLLTNLAPDLAVARGAAYYALARRGEGMRISGGAARAYYIEVDTGKKNAPNYVCLTPRGLEEGAEIDLSSRGLELLTNRPVRFRLFSSALREGDRPGDVLSASSEELTELPPLYTVLRHPRSSQERPIRVSLGARLTEIGTLELWALHNEPAPPDAAPSPPLRWRLQFDLRSSETAAVDTAPAPESAAPSDDGGTTGLVAAAAEHIRQAFSGNASPVNLPRQLTTVLGPRDGWSTATLRGLWEELKKHREARGKSAAHEARWLNLGGFCLRPGFGYPLDDWRVKEAWRLFNAGLSHERDEPCRLEWWILWRRIAGGLSRTQQDELWKRVAPLLLPQARRVDKKPPSPQEAAELWRTLAACERLEWKKKVELGETLLGLLEKRRSEYGLWALGRFGGRMPLYGSIDNVAPPAVAERWIDRLLKLPIKADREGTEEALLLAQAAAELGRMTADRVRDISEPMRQRLAERLRALADGSFGEHLAHTVCEVIPREEREERFAFGDTLPAGLRLVSEA
jgi:molecular chaperone DnaK (HSP70)